MFTGFCNNIDKYGIEAAAKYAKDCGFDGVEFFYMARDPKNVPDIEEARKYKEVLDRVGLEVPCVSVGVTLVRNDNPEKICQSDLDGLLRALDFAAAVGAKYLHHTLILTLEKENLEGLTYDGVFPLVMEAAKIAANKAAQLGITVLYEPQGAFFNGEEGFDKFYTEIKKYCKNVGVCGDVANTCWVSEFPYSFIEKYSSEIYHAHLKDYLLSDCAGEDYGPALRGPMYIKAIPIGEGDLDFKRLLEIYRSHGYSAYYSLEDGPNVTSKERIASIMEYLKSTYEQK